MSDANSALARLINDVKEANGWSDYDLARRAERAGHQISKSKIADMRTAGVTTIVPDRIRALAAALDLPVTEVLRAALETVSLPAGPGSGSVEQAIQRDPALSALAKRQLLAMLKEARRPPAETQHAGMSGTADPPATQEELDLAANRRRRPSTVQQRREEQDRAAEEPGGATGAVS